MNEHIGNPPNTGAAKGPQRRQRLLLIGIGLLFAAPVIVAWLFYANPQWHPQGTVNHGTLIAPVRTLSVAALQELDGTPLPADWLQGKWTFVYLQRGTCDAVCAENLYRIRQVRLAQGKNIDRLQRLLVLVGEPVIDAQKDILAAHAGLQITQLPAADSAAFIGLFASAPRQDPVAAQRIYLVDPFGNLMMQYDVASDPAGMIKDLQRLLKISQIG